MVLIKDIAVTKREEAIESYRERIQANMDQLREKMLGINDLRRLKAIASNVEKLSTGRRALTEEEITKKKEFNRLHYQKNKEGILSGNKRSRRELRELKEVYMNEDFVGENPVVSGGDGANEDS